MPTIRVDDDVYAVLHRGVSYGITPNVALRAVLGLPQCDPQQPSAPAPQVIALPPSRTGACRTDHGKLARLVDTGLLHDGQVVTWRRRHLDVTHVATVTAEGHLRTSDGQLHLSPDSCATTLAGYPIRGWKLWRTSNGSSLHQLRDKLSADQAPRTPRPA